MKNRKIFWNRRECAIDIGHLGVNRTVGRSKEGSIDPHFLCDGAEYLLALAHIHPVRSYA